MSRSGVRDEAQKAAKWYLRQSMKAREESDQQTVFLLNLLQEHRHEIEARDGVMRESSILVSKLQAEVELLTQQLNARDSELQALKDRDRASDQQARVLDTDCSSPGGRTDLIIARRQRTLSQDTLYNGSSGGGWDAGGASRPSNVIGTCSTLQEAWARLRLGSDGAAAPPQSPRDHRKEPPASRDASFTPPTPPPRIPAPLFVSTSSVSGAPPAPSTAPLTQSATTGQQRPQHTTLQHPDTAQVDQRPQACGQQEQQQQQQQQQEQQQEQQQQVEERVALQQQQLLLQEQQQEWRRLEAQVASLTATVATLNAQLEVARREASEATSNYLTVRKDFEILTRKYDSLMQQKLEAEEQRDRLFNPHLDVELIRAAMPAVDAALEAAERRLAAAGEVLAACQAEAEDAARVQNQQRRKWIQRLESMQTRLQERESRLAQVEGQLGGMLAALGPASLSAVQCQGVSARGVGCGGSEGGDAAAVVVARAGVERGPTGASVPGAGPMGVRVWAREASSCCRDVEPAGGTSGGGSLASFGTAGSAWSGQGISSGEGQDSCGGMACELGSLGTP